MSFFQLFSFQWVALRECVGCLFYYIFSLLIPMIIEVSHRYCRLLSFKREGMRPGLRKWRGAVFRASAKKGVLFDDINWFLPEASDSLEAWDNSDKSWRTANNPLDSLLPRPSSSPPSREGSVTKNQKIETRVKIETQRGYICPTLAREKHTRAHSYYLLAGLLKRILSNLVILLTLSPPTGRWGEPVEKRRKSACSSPVNSERTVLKNWTARQFVE